MQTSLQCYIKYTHVQKQLLCKTECDNLLVVCENESIKTVQDNIIPRVVILWNAQKTSV